MSSSSTYLSVVGTIEKRSQEKPDKPAFIFYNERFERLLITRQQLWSYCRKFAWVLHETGVRVGDAVCNTLPNCPQRIVTELGTITAGAISMNGQICFTDGSDFLVSLNNGKAVAIILDVQDTKGAFAILKPKLTSYDPQSGEVSCPEVPSLKYLLMYDLQKDDAKSFLNDLDERKESFHVDISPDDICQYMCTSGSTSMFKLVAYTSRHILVFGSVYKKSCNMRESDKFMNCRLMGWLGGYPSYYLAIGLTRVVFDESNGRTDDFSYIQWKLAVLEKAEIVFIPPMSFIAFDKVRRESDDPEMRMFKARLCVTGGGPLVKKQMESAFNLVEEVANFYASTEALVTSGLFSKSLEVFEEFDNGPLVPEVEIKVCDRDGKEIPVGERGEIFIKAPLPAVYYVNNPEKTAETFLPDRWVRLGDMGKITPGGHLFVIGRSKFVIIRGSALYYPQVVESLIRACPGIQGVLVTGVPDELIHEEICALIVKEPGVKLSADDIKTFCENRLANKAIVSPIPRYFLFVDEFPLMPNKKLDRKMAKQLACELLGIKQKV